MPPISHDYTTPRPTPAYEELVQDHTLLGVIKRYLIANRYCDRDALANLIGLELPEVPHDPLS